jgi:hypothetical protein
MSIQTEAMRKLADGDEYVTAGQHRETKLWHGMLMINHPTPSGCDRWMMAYSDSRGWPDEKTAKAEFKKLLQLHDAREGRV